MRPSTTLQPQPLIHTYITYFFKQPRQPHPLQKSRQAPNHSTVNTPIRTLEIVYISYYYSKYSNHQRRTLKWSGWKCSLCFALKGLGLAKRAWLSQNGERRAIDIEKSKNSQKHEKCLIVAFGGDGKTFCWKMLSKQRLLDVKWESR